MKNFKLNKKGFTLIELMIVIAIIGVLAAIAIPNYISYRNKSYCTSTESVARNVAAAVAEYYSIPTRTAAVPNADTTDLNFSADALSRYDVTIIALSANGVNTGIRIQATDPNTRCPEDYRDASDNWTGFVYTFDMQ